MKSKNYVLTYVSALVIGILLLIYHDRVGLYNTVVVAIGILVAVPSLLLVLMELFRKKPAVESGQPESRVQKTQHAATNWAIIIAGVAGLALGIWMLSTPNFFIKAIIYTLGAILMLGGIVQIVAIYGASRPLKPLMLWFIIPAITLIAGLVIILLGPDKVSSIAGLIAGICFVVYAANGFASAGREAREISVLENKSAKALESKPKEEKKAQ